MDQDKILLDEKITQEECECVTMTRHLKEIVVLVKILNSLQ